MNILNRTISDKGKTPDDKSEQENNSMIKIEEKKTNSMDNLKSPCLNSSNIKWNSMRDELVLNMKEDYSFSLNKGISAEMSDKRLHSLILGDKSNSEIKNSCASHYIDYVDQFKNNFLELIREDKDEFSGCESIEEDDENSSLKNGEKSRAGIIGSKLNLNHSTNILLNSTILSNCFNNLSFHNQDNISKEVDFIEEDPLDDSCSFLMKWKNETNKQNENQLLPFSKIYKNQDSFSFGSNKRMSGILDELDKQEELESVDSALLGVTKETKYFYQKKKSEPNHPKDYDPDEEHIQINVTNLSPNGMEEEKNQEYVLTRKGLVNSKKNTATSCLVIGRMKQEDNGLIPNDIVLPDSDRAISRIHGCLIYKYGFSKRKIPRNFLTFLSGRNPHIGGKKCLIRKLPKYALMRVYEFLKPNHKFYMHDLGSIHGTYIKLRFKEEYKIKKRDIFLVGSENLIQVKNLSVPNGNKASLQALYSILAEEMTEDVAILGLTREQMQVVEEKKKKKEKMIKQILKTEDESFFKTQDYNQSSIGIPMLTLEIKNGPSSVKSRQILIANQEEKVFTIGRVPENDLVINAFMVSRKHLRIVYKNNGWYVADGINDKSSMNGTWLSLSSMLHRREREISDPLEIKDGDQIKISDSHLTFNFNNFKNKKIC